MEAVRTSAPADRLPSLVDIIRQEPGPQMCYQIAFCFWLLTFEQEIAEEINRSVSQLLYLPIQTDALSDRKYDIIPLLTGVAQAAVKEKVIRVIISTFRGLVTKAPAANLPAMLVVQLLPFVKNLSGRKWSDEDIVEDVQFLKDELSARFESLTCVASA
jgi:V-type H+-transporting ATPase subunit H